MSFLLQNKANIMNIKCAFSFYTQCSGCPKKPIIIEVEDGYNLNALALLKTTFR